LTCPTSPAGTRTEMLHPFLLVWHAFLVSLFFAFLWRNNGAERRKLFLKTFVIMVGGGILVGWLMYPYP
jgi:hypothetical protein